MPDPTITLSGLPRDTYRRLQAEAARNGRSLEDEAVMRLRLSLDSGGVRFNVLGGRLGTAPDFSEPLSDDELDAWEGRGPS